MSVSGSNEDRSINEKKKKKQLGIESQEPMVLMSASPAEFPDEAPGGEDEASLSNLPEIIGTNQSEVLFGTDEADFIDPYAGDDQIFAGGGDDVILLSGGADQVDGGEGRDTIDLFFRRECCKR